MRKATRNAIAVAIMGAVGLLLPAGPLSAPAGAAMATKADFNGDGYADLAVGVPDDHAPDSKDAPQGGGVNVLYGGGSGLTATGDHWLNYDPKENDDFGAALAWGDFNADGRSDLAVGIPCRDTNGVWNSGAVRVYYGSSTGITGAGAQIFDQGTGVGDDPEPGDHFGTALAAGDFDGDGYADLAVGAPDEDLTAAQNGGVVHVLFGSASGLTTAEDQLWSQDSPGIASAPDYEERFGASVVAANFGNGVRADLAIGVPGQAVGTDAKAGAVHVLYGTATGLSSASSQFWHQDAGITSGDGAEPQDQFGTALAAGDFKGDGFADLAVGVPFEDKNGSVSDIGAVNVINGTPTGLTAAGSQFWHQDSTGIADTEEAGDQVGFALATGDFGNGSQADLAIGAPGEDSGSVPDTGVVHVLYGSGVGLTAVGSQLWSQAGSVDGDPEGGDRFGQAVFAANFGKESQADLAVGVPSEDFELWDPIFSDTLVADQGAVNILYGAPAGLATSGSQFWWQWDLGGGARRASEHFGAALA
jgi:hypothetical protein